MAAGSGAKTVWIVRHGEAEHNALIAQGKAEEGHALRDPNLTARGVAQSAKLRNNPMLAQALAASGAAGAADLLVISPQRRTIQTASAAFGALKPAIPLQLNPDLQVRASILALLFYSDLPHCSRFDRPRPQTNALSLLLPPLTICARGCLAGVRRAAD